MVTIENLRTIPEKPDLETDGFTYVNRPVATTHKFEEETYHFQTELDEDAADLVKEL